MLFSPIIAFGATFCVINEAELQAALTAAASDGEDNFIQIIQGTYNGNFTYASTEGNSLTVEGGYTEGCASREIEPTNTVLDGGGIGTVLALVSMEAADFSVEGLTFRNGNTSTGEDGGGLYARTEGHVTLTNNTFTGNTATSGSGGGAYVYGNSTLTNNLFTENTSGDFGGGIYSCSYFSVLTNNTISRNTAENQGGEICLIHPYLPVKSGLWEIYNNIIWNNSASVGN